jgi:8-oxo-dGTP pyrophosphatase MutT (NUDIX family)
MKLLLRIAFQLAKVYWFITRPVSAGVRVLMVRDGQVLLVRHSYQDGWFMPGGGIKRGETLVQAAHREASEECGATLGNLELLGAYTQFFAYRNDQVILFYSDQFTLSGKSDAEIEQVAFFPPDQLPEDTSPGHRRRIEEFSKGQLVKTGLW